VSGGQVFLELFDEIFMTNRKAKTPTSCGKLTGVFGFSESLALVVRLMRSAIAATPKGERATDFPTRILALSK
jgi:hypothetical protein